VITLNEICFLGCLCCCTWRVTFGDSWWSTQQTNCRFSVVEYHVSWTLIDLFCLFSYISQLLQSELKLTTISVQIVGQSLKNAQIVKRYLEAYSIVSTHCANNTSPSGGYEPEDVLAQKTSQLLLNLGS